MRTSFILDDDGILTGFLGMPVHPFVWVSFTDDGLSNRPQIVPAPDQEDRLMHPLEMDFSEVPAAQVVAVSEELVGLFDKYAVAFSSKLSESFSYIPAAIWELPDKLQVFQFLNVKHLRNVAQSFMLLIDSWLELHAPLQAKQTVNLHELWLLQDLLMNFIYLTAGWGDIDFGWSAERKLLVTHMFTPSASRMRLDSKDFTERERLRVEQGWKHVS